MFTVILCSGELIDKCKTDYGEFLAPLLNNGDFAFCKWNTSADNFADALPELPKLIAGKRSWTALTVLDSELFGYDNINKHNPYNYVDSDNSLTELNTADEILEFRRKDSDRLNKAVENPLTRLSMWLLGSPSTEYPPVPDSYASLPDINDPEYAQKLKEKLLSPLEVELDRAVENKGKFLCEHFSMEGEIKNKPEKFIALCERRHVNDNDANRDAWAEKEENNYTRFCEDNLYSERIRFFVKDIDYIKKSRVDSSYFNFLVLVLLLAGTESTYQMFRERRLYSLHLNIDREKMDALCYEYIGKLYASIDSIEKTKHRINHRGSLPIDRQDFENRFISDVTIPVSIPSDFRKEDLYADESKIGLSKDCPTDEEMAWGFRFDSIKKKFIRYLREPRRSVKRSVTGVFRNLNKVEDEDVLRANEFQLEDLQIHLNDEEEKMVKQKTIRIYNTDEFNKRMDESNNKISNYISKRMTRLMTVVIGLICVIVYAASFIPLVFSDLNSVQTSINSFVLAGAAIGAFTLAGFVCLVVMKFILKKLFKDFNDEMKNILLLIDAGLEDFSKYLSHACNVMRDFSCFNLVNKAKSEKCRVLDKHMFYIRRQILKCENIFFVNMELDSNRIAQCEPFDYDFTQDIMYCYSISSLCNKRNIMFLGEEGETEIPVEYITSVTAEREELYG